MLFTYSLRIIVAIILEGENVVELRYEDNELEEKSTIKNFLIVQKRLNGFLTLWNHDV